MLGTLQSFFDMMEAEKFTVFSVNCDWKKDQIQATMSKEWSTKANWAGKKSTGLLKRIKKTSNGEALQIIEKYQLNEYFQRIVSLLKVGKHKKIQLFFDAKTNVRCIVAFHTTHKKHIVGGIRRCPPSKLEENVIVDTLSLAREMSFRCAVGQMACSGAALLVHTGIPKNDVADAFFGFLAYIIERNELIVAPETGFSKKEIAKIKKHTNRCVVEEQDKKNAISTAAMHSVYFCIKEALKFRYGDDSLARTFGIQGMGTIGSSLAAALLKENADLIIADINPVNIESFLKSCAKNNSVTTVEINEVGIQMGHVFSPCAFSGVLTRDYIRGINYHIVIGGANHLLAANTYEEELVLADRLVKKEIIYLPDWISNVGAVMYGITLFTDKDNYVKPADIEKIVVPLVREILQESKKLGKSPLEIAYQKFESVVYE